MTGFLEIFDDLPEGESGLLGSQEGALANERTVPIPAGKTYPKEAFALEIRGDSMIDKGINDGDIVVVVKGREANNGDVVVALIDGETTLKTLVHKNAKWKLRSENPKHKDPILTDQSAIQAVMIDKL